MIELVIKIPREKYKAITEMYGTFPKDMKEWGLEAIKNGTPLPKGHGKIGDLDSIMNDISNSINEMTNIGISIDGQYLWAKLNDAIDNAPSIIEAEGSENE